MESRRTAPTGRPRPAAWPRPSWPRRRPRPGHRARSPAAHRPVRSRRTSSPLSRERSPVSTRPRTRLGPRQRSAGPARTAHRRHRRDALSRVIVSSMGVAADVVLGSSRQHEGERQRVRHLGSRGDPFGAVVDLIETTILGIVVLDRATHGTRLGVRSPVLHSRVGPAPFSRSTETGSWLGPRHARAPPSPRASPCRPPGRG